jgi:hypothetical protein
MRQSVRPISQIANERAACKLASSAQPYIAAALEISVHVTPVPALLEAAIVFGLVLGLSFAASAALRRLPPCGLPRGRDCQGAMLLNFRLS